LTGLRIRTDLSVTLFLSEPDEYDGGEFGPNVAFSEIPDTRGQTGGGGLQQQRHQRYPERQPEISFFILRRVCIL
jgi:predicted 2-oxoglutarate/Fe(II)-dependent dioxygenase YbiX